MGIDHASGAITGSELDVMSDDELARRIRTVNVFARMVPALVITDDDFASIADGVRQGRGIFDNLRKAMAYITAVHVPIFGMSLFPLFVPSWPLVLLPLQIAILELIIDPACSIVFESEAIDPEIMQQPPRRIGGPMFERRLLVVSALQGASVLVAVLSVYLWTVLGDPPDDVVRSVTFASLVVGNLGLILVNRLWRLSVWESFRQRRNRTLKWILGGAGTMLVVLLTLPAMRAQLRRASRVRPRSNRSPPPSALGTPGAGGVASGRARSGGGSIARPSGRRKVNFPSPCTSMV